LPVCQQDIILVTVSGGVKCAISNELLDSGSDVDHDVDSQIFTGIFYHRVGQAQL